MINKINNTVVFRKLTMLIISRRHAERHPPIEIMSSINIKIELANNNYRLLERK